MKAFRFYEPGVPWKLEEIPTPIIGDSDVLVKIKASGICGSDTHYRTGRSATGKVPVTLGHEMAGVVEKVGKRVSDVSVGDRVCVHYVVSCGDCVHCSQGYDNRCRNRMSIGHDLDGGFAEYVAIPARNAFKLSEAIPFDQGAIIGCAVTTAFHALRVGELQPGDSVAVFGLGGVGMSVVALARACGASKIIGVDLDDFKLGWARDFGADLTINATKEDPVEKIQSLTHNWGVDVSIEVAGTEKTMEYAIQSASGKSPYAHGRVVCIAAVFHPIKLVGRVLREGAFKKSGDHTRHDLRRVIDLVAAQRIDLSKAITHRLPFEKLNQGIEMLEQKKENILRMVVTQ